MKWTSLTAPLALCLVLALSPAAFAAGGPVPPVQGHAIGIAGSAYRYAVFAAGSHTVVKRVEAGAGPAASELRVSGRYGIPGVDYAGSTTGLSADGRTLILAELPGNGPPRTTRLLVIDTGRLTVRARLALPGWSTVDAVSPDGRWLYLIHYPSSDITRYEVQAYDLPAHRLLAKPIVDPRDRDEAMTGFAVTRVTSVNGRWAYTLYSRPSGVAFVHALDTTGRRAVCVDLPSLSDVNPGNAQLRLTRGGGMLEVDSGGVRQVLINTRTFAVTRGVRLSAPAAVRTVPDAHRGRRAPGGVPWELIAGAIAVLAMLALHVGHGLKPWRSGRRIRGPREGVFNNERSGAVGRWIVEERRDQTDGR